MQARPNNIDVLDPIVAVASNATSSITASSPPSAYPPQLSSPPSPSLCKVIKELLGDKVEKVVIFDCVVDSPCCLLTGECGWTAVERIMKAQVLRNFSMAGYKSNKKTLEVNPENSIMEEQRKQVDTDKNNKYVKDLILLMFETTLLNSSSSLDEPNTFGNMIHRMFKRGINIDNDEVSVDDVDTEMPPLGEDVA